MRCLQPSPSQPGLVRLQTTLLRAVYHDTGLHWAQLGMWNDLDTGYINTIITNKFTEIVIAAKANNVTKPSEINPWGVQPRPPTQQHQQQTPSTYSAAVAQWRNANPEQVKLRKHLCVSDQVLKNCNGKHPTTGREHKSECLLASCVEAHRVSDSPACLGELFKIVRPDGHVKVPTPTC